MAQSIEKLVVNQLDTSGSSITCNGKNLSNVGTAQVNKVTSNAGSDTTQHLNPMLICFRSVNVYTASAGAVNVTPTGYSFTVKAGMLNTNFSSGMEFIARGYTLAGASGTKKLSFSFSSYTDAGVSISSTITANWEIRVSIRRMSTATSADAYAIVTHGTSVYSAGNSGVAVSSMDSSDLTFSLLVSAANSSEMFVRSAYAYVF